MSFSNPYGNGGRFGAPWGGRGRGNRGGNRGGFNQHMRPPMMPPMMGFDGGVPGPWAMQPHDIMAWCDLQNPFIIKRIYFHTKWLLEQRGVDPNDESEPAAPPPPNPTEASDTSDWYNDAPEGGNGTAAPPGQFPPGAPGQFPPGPPGQMAPGPPGLGKPRHPWQKPQMQWTPAGWVEKNNSHKVTSTARPLPSQELIPPPSQNFPDAQADRAKLRMLESNVNMMQFELNKITRQYKIYDFDRDDLSQYPEDQQSRLKIAIGCVTNAEKTLDEFKVFLKEDKYKEWNEEQKKAQEEHVKNMIGEMPTGVPFKKRKADEEDEEEEQKCLDEQTEGQEGQEEEEEEEEEEESGYQQQGQQEDDDDE